MLHVHETVSTQYPYPYTRIDTVHMYKNTIESSESVSQRNRCLVTPLGDTAIEVVVIIFIKQNATALLAHCTRFFMICGVQEKCKIVMKLHKEKRIPSSHVLLVFSPLYGEQNVLPYMY